MPPGLLEFLWALPKVMVAGKTAWCERPGSASVMLLGPEL